MFKRLSLLSVKFFFVHTDLFYILACVKIKDLISDSIMHIIILEKKQSGTVYNQVCDAILYLFIFNVQTVITDFLNSIQ